MADTVPLSYFGPEAVDYWERFPEGTRVRWRRERISFIPGEERSGEGTVALIWNCMGELTWDIEPPVKVDPQSFVPTKQRRVGIAPALGDVLELVTPSRTDRQPPNTPSGAKGGYVTNGEPHA